MADESASIQIISDKMTAATWARLLFHGDHPPNSEYHVARSGIVS